MRVSRRYCLFGDQASAGARLHGYFSQAPVLLSLHHRNRQLNLISHLPVSTFKHSFLIHTCTHAGPAPDGETFMVTALYFAANRWGDSSGRFNYTEAANTVGRA